MNFLSKLKQKSDNCSIGLFDALLIVILAIILGILIGSKINTKKDLPNKDENIEKFIENYNYIIDNYYEDIDKKKLIDDAIAGMMQTLDDPYSVYMDSESTKNINISLNGEYEGLGLAIVKNDDDFIEVVGVFKNSVAEKSDIKVGDIIKKINNKDVKKMTPSDFSNYVLDGKDKEFILLVERDSKEKEIKLKKSVVVIDSVVSKVINKDNIKIGYMYVSVFASNTALQFKTKLKELEKENIDSLIIDVRDNTGGHLTTVEAILKEFLTKKQIVYKIKDKNKITKVYGTAKKNKNYKIVLLGNENSASASEMLIASLKENLKAKFIGKKTYGKGTVQEMVTLDSKDKYKITTKKWLTPLGNWINDTKGIEPDYKVDTENRYYDDENKIDNQLEKAVDVIKQK